MADNSLSFNISALDRASATFLGLADTVDKLSRKLDELGAREAKPEVDIEAAKAQADLDALSAHLDEIGHRGVTAKVDVKTDDAERQLDSFTGRVQALSALVLLAAPAAGAAILAGIGGGFAALGVLAERNNAQVQQGLKNVELAAKSTLTQGFEPMVPAMVGLEQAGANAASNLESSFHQAAQSAAPLLEAVGVDFIAAAHKGVTDVNSDLSTLGPIAHAIGQDFVDAEQGVQGFLKSLDVQGSAQTLALLGQVAKDDLPAIGNLVSALTPLTNMLLSVLDPVLKDTANDLSLLKPVFSAVEAVVTPLAPAIGAVTPPVLALLLASKLLTGSWTDLGGAATKLTGPFTSTEGAATSLANTFGITTAKQNAASRATLEQAASAAALKASLSEEAAAQALVNLQTDGSVKSVYELDAALAAQVAATDEAIAAQEALAGAEEGASLAMGPLALIMGVAGIALAGFIGGADKASNSTQTMTGEINKLEQAAGQGSNALAQLFSSDANSKQLLDTLKKYGVTANDLASALNGDAGAQEKVAAATQQSLDTAKNKLAQDQKTLDSMTQVSRATANANGQNVVSAQVYQQHKAAVAADQAAVDAATAANTDAQSQIRNTADALQQQGIELSGSQRLWNAEGSALQSASQSFSQATSGLKYLFDAQNTSITTAGQAAEAQRQLQAAVTSAQQSYQAAAAGVAQADHQVQVSAESVAAARDQQKKAVEGVSIAQNTYTKAITTQTNAENALIAARAAEIQQLENLKRQVADQGDSLASAQLNLFDAQQAVNTAGIQGQSLDKFGPITSANEANYKLLLQLSQAQHGYNDALAQTQQLNQQNADAQKAGVNGSTSVISAQTQLASAQDGVASAAHGVKDANYAAQQAAVALKNAQYEQQQASIAVQTATVAEHAARVVLTTATANNTTTVDGNSVSAATNRTSIEGMYDANVALYGPTVQATIATEQQGAAAGYSKTQVDGVITSLGGLNGTVSVFSVVGTPSLNLGALLNQAAAEGISPYSLGLPADQVTLARGPIGSSYAVGGPVFGAGTETSDSIPAWLSNDEHVWTAAEVRGVGGHDAVAAMRKAARGFASGGPVATDGKALLGLNFRLAGWDGILQGVSNYIHAFGKAAPNLPTQSGPIDLGAFTPTAGGGGGQIAYAAGAGVAQWAPLILQALAALGQPASWLGTVERRMNQESGGNPNSINNWDSNAARGDPSRGLMQTIGSTFNAYKPPGATNIYDPYSNIYAGLNYAIHRYGSLSALNRPGGYDSGGWLKPGETGVNHLRKPEAVLTPEESEAFKQLAASAASGTTAQAPNVTVNVYAQTNASASDIAHEAVRHLTFAMR